MDFGIYSEGSSEVLPAGPRRLRLVSVSQRDTSPQYLEMDDNGNPRNPFRWKWVFEVTGGANLGETCDIYTNATISSGSAAKPILEALLGKALRDGDRPHSTEVLGNEIDCYLADKGEKGGIKNRIIDPKHVAMPTTEGSLREQEYPDLEAAWTAGEQRRKAGAAK